MNPTEEESAPLVIRDRGGSQTSSSSTGGSLQVHLYFVPATKKATTIHISSGQISAENVCIQAGKKSGKSCSKQGRQEPWVMILLTFLQESCLSTSVFLAWRQLTFPFGILHHTCSTRKKTGKSASESGGWETTRNTIRGNFYKVLVVFRFFFGNWFDQGPRTACRYSLTRDRTSPVLDHSGIAYLFAQVQNDP